MVELPEIPVCAAMIVCPPISTLCATWIEVIEFHATPDNRRFKRAAVDTRIGSDFDIIFNDDFAHLRKFHVSLAIPDETKAVRADHSTGMDDDSIPDLHIFINDCARIDRAVVSDLASFPDIASRFDHGRGFRRRRRIRLLLRVRF